MFPLHQFEAVCCPLVATAESKLSASVTRLEGRALHQAYKFELWDFPGGSTCFLAGSDGEESACNEGDLSSIPGLGRSPGEGNGKLFQNACLENPMDRGDWQATVHGGRKESDTD